MKKNLDTVNLVSGIGLVKDTWRFEDIISKYGLFEKIPPFSDDFGGERHAIYSDQDSQLTLSFLLPHVHPFANFNTGLIIIGPSIEKNKKNYLLYIDKTNIKLEDPKLFAEAVNYIGTSLYPNFLKHELKYFDILNEQARKR